MIEINTTFGSGNQTYTAAGGIEGITALVNRFYDRMESMPEAKALRDMHPSDLSLSRQKLIYFLSGWMGGPKLYAEKFGSISIPKAHSHLSVTMESKNAWLRCMEVALDELDYPTAFKEYLIRKLAIPAESIRLMCEPKPCNQ